MVHVDQCTSVWLTISCSSHAWMTNIFGNLKLILSIIKLSPDCRFVASHLSGQKFAGISNKVSVQSGWPYSSLQKIFHLMPSQMKQLEDSNSLINAWRSIEPFLRFCRVMLRLELSFPMEAYFSTRIQSEDCRLLLQSMSALHSKSTKPHDWIVAIAENCLNLSAQSLHVLEFEPWICTPKLSNTKDCRQLVMIPL